jgi:hypothetical protein
MFFAMGETRTAYKILKRRNHAENPRRRWKDNIRMDLKEMGWEGVNWINLAQHRDRWRDLVNMIMNLRFP